MATSGYHKDKDDSTYCPVCLDIFKTPRILPCSHSFCHSCLVKCAEKVKNEIFQCPICRGDTKEKSCFSPAEKWITGFPVNYALISQIEKETHKIKIKQREDIKQSYQEATETLQTDIEENTMPDASDCVPCLRDKVRIPAALFCYECSEDLCDDCVKHHKKNKFTSDHKLIDSKRDKKETEKLDFVNNLTKCVNHSTEEVKYICRDHDQLCCNECAIVTHRKCHDLVSIEDDIDGNTSIKENIEKLESHASKLLEHELKHNSALNESEKCIKNELHCIKFQLDDAYRVFEESVMKRYSGECQRMRHLTSVQSVQIEGFMQDLCLSKEKALTASRLGQNLHLYILQRKMRLEMEQHVKRLTQLHKSSNCTTVFLAGKEHATDNLIKSLNNSLSVKQQSSRTSLPALPTFAMPKKSSNKCGSVTWACPDTGIPPGYRGMQHQVPGIQPGYQRGLQSYRVPGNPPGNKQCPQYKGYL